MYSEPDTPRGDPEYEFLIKERFMGVSQWIEIQIQCHG